MQKRGSERNLRIVVLMLGRKRDSKIAYSVTQEKRMVELIDIFEPLMDCNTMFLGIFQLCCRLCGVRRALGLHQKCSERSSYGVVTT